MAMQELDKRALRAMRRPLEIGSIVKFLDEGEYIFGTIERLGGSHDRVAIVHWDDGKTTNIYVDRLERA